MELWAELRRVREERDALGDFVYRSVLTLSQDEELAAAVKESIELNIAKLGDAKHACEEAQKGGPAQRGKE
jgi:hypothetical protein